MTNDIKDVVEDEPKCVAGCKHFYGGEIAHHKHCPFYPESRTEMYDKAITALTTFSEENAAMKVAITSEMRWHSAKAKKISKHGKTCHSYNRMKTHKARAKKLKQVLKNTTTTQFKK